MTRLCSIGFWSVAMTVVATAASAADFSASFTWKGTAACGSTSPAFVIKNAPKATKMLRFALRDYDAPNFQHGGSTIPYSGAATVPAGAINHVGPCPPAGQKHTYIWSFEALDPSGTVTAKTEARGVFPQ